MNESYRSYKKDEIKNLVYSKLKNILNSKTKIILEEPMSFPISFKFNVNFSKKNLLVLGDGSYNVHPIAGRFTKLPKN